MRFYFTLTICLGYELVSSVTFTNEGSIRIVAFGLTGVAYNALIHI